jgi:hypothetical protein
VILGQKDQHQIPQVGVKVKNKANKPFLDTEVLKRCHTKNTASTHFIAEDLTSYMIRNELVQYNNNLDN